MTPDVASAARTSKGRSCKQLPCGLHTRTCYTQKALHKLAPNTRWSVRPLDNFANWLWRRNQTRKGYHLRALLHLYSVLDLDLSAVSFPFSAKDFEHTTAATDSGDVQRTNERSIERTNERIFILFTRVIDKYTRILVYIQPSTKTDQGAELICWKPRDGLKKLTKQGMTEQTKEVEEEEE